MQLKNRLLLQNVAVLQKKPLQRLSYQNNTTWKTFWNLDMLDVQGTNVLEFRNYNGKAARIIQLGIHVTCLGHSYGTIKKCNAKAARKNTTWKAFYTCRTQLCYNKKGNSKTVRIKTAEK